MCQHVISPEIMFHLHSRGETAVCIKCTQREEFRGISLGRVTINKVVLKRPDRANKTSAQAITANGTALPQNSDK